MKATQSSISLIISMAVLFTSMGVSAEEKSILDGATVSKFTDFEPTWTWNEVAGIDGNFKSLFTTNFDNLNGDGSKEI